MVDNITLKCYDKEVYHHLRYGTFVEKSNWINGRWYDKLVLNNGKSGDDAHDLIIEFYEDFMKIYGSIRKWYYGATSLDDLTKTDLEKAWRKVAKRLGISFDTLRTFEISVIEIGLNVPFDMECVEMIHRIRAFKSKCYELNDSRPTCRKFVSGFFTAKIYDKIAEINKDNRNVLIRNPDLYPEKNALRVEFTLKGGRRKVLSRLKVGTLGGLLEEYTRIVNFFWRNCQAFAFDNIGRRPSFRPKRGSLKELTDYFVILGLASLSHAELDGYTGLLSKGAQRDFRKWLRRRHEQEKDYLYPDYRIEFTEAIKWHLIDLIRLNNRQRRDNIDL